MNIMTIGTFDAAGVHTNFARSWNKYGYGTWRTFFEHNYMALPDDLNHSSSIDEVQKVIDETDVFFVNVVIDRGEVDSHLINDWDTIGIPTKNGITLLLPYIELQKKPIIFFINGSNNIRKWSPIYNNIFSHTTTNLAVSTPDLLTHFPTAKYMPGFIDVEKSFWNLPTYENSKLWIGHFPTNPKIKNTEEFVHMINGLSHLDIQVDIINGVAHDQSINFRRDMDITFDHLGGYYGINSLESAALGIVNMVRLTEENKRIFCEFAGTDDTPWDLVENMDDVKKQIEFYYMNPTDLEVKKKFTAEWMRNNWNPEKHLDKIKEYCDGLTRINK